MDWLAGPARLVPSLIEEFDEFAWRMVAAGFPLLGATLQLRTSDLILPSSALP
jgi:hypothetical protein